GSDAAGCGFSRRRADFRDERNFRILLVPVPGGMSPRFRGERAATLLSKWHSSLNHTQKLSFYRSSPNRSSQKTEGGNIVSRLRGSLRTESWKPTPERKFRLFWSSPSRW